MVNLFLGSKIKLLFLCVFFLNYFQVHLGDNWSFVAELLKLTCNPKVSTTNSPWSQSHTQDFPFLIGCIKLCVRVCETGRAGGGADQDARPLLPDSLSAVGTEHQRRLCPVGLLQQESGEYQLL